MCGIAGYLGSAEFNASRFQWALAHRGPDAHGAWSIPLGGDRDHGRRLHLVHTRLKIVDLTDAAAQPMTLQHGANTTTAAGPSAPTHALAYNGEIYNFHALRAELQALGHEFRSSGDTEVLLHGYAQWGTDVFARCDGMFACAIYDGVRQQLVLARDHMGIKPLYWARTRDGGLVFASEVRAIAASGLVDTAIDHAAVGEYLALGSFQEPATVYEAVRAFPAATFTCVSLASEHSEQVSDGKNRSPGHAQRYWSPESFCAASSAAGAGVDPAQTGASHRELLADTIRAQLVADVPVGVFLSGGLDSTVLLELLPAPERDRVTAFTLGGELTSNDEADVAARTCRNLGIRHIIVRPTREEISTWVADGLAAMDQPSCDGLNTYLVSRAARAAGLVAVLNGAGADELHGAYGHAFALARFIRTFSAAGGLARTLTRAGAPIIRGLRGAVYAERLRLMTAAVPDAERVLDERRRFFTPSQIAALWPAGSAHRSRPAADSTPAAVRPDDVRSQITVAELHGYLRNTLLRDGDWATMANQQEMRVPYLGRRYMEFMLGLPWAAKTPANGAAKPLLAGLVSASNRELLALPKRGFVLNYDALLRGPYRGAFERAAVTLREQLGFSATTATLLDAPAAADSGKQANRTWGLLPLGHYLATAPTPALES